MPFYHRVFALLMLFNATTTAIHHSIHETRTTAGSGWHKTRRAQPDLILPMRVALTQSNLETAEDDLYGVSNPTSPKFSVYWTAHEVAHRFAPSKEATQEVVEWLNQSGIHPSRLTGSHSGGWLYFNSTVFEAERLLKAEYHLYKRTDTVELQAFCDDYSLPTSLRGYIDFVTPTVHFSRRENGKPNLRKRVQHKKIEGGFKAFSKLPTRKTDSLSNSGSSTVSSTCYKYTTPDCLRALYNIPISNTSHPHNSLGIFQVAWESWLPGDLDSFFGTFAPALIGTRPTMERIDGGYWQDTYQFFPFNAEADLDFEYSMSLTYPLNVTNYQVGDMFFPGTINNLLAALDQSYCGSLDSQVDPIFPDVTYPGGYNKSDCGNHNPTNVISISYANDEVAYPPAYERRACLEFLKLGLQGISVIVSTADFGVAGQSNLCIDPITGQAKGAAGHFNPTFPATCPYVTSVGGSQLRENASASHSDQETAFYQGLSATIGSSGGGFSNVFATPLYQLGAVQEYLFHETAHLRNISANFNANGRGFPDVAANAANYVIVADGQLDTVCECPISCFESGIIIAIELSKVPARSNFVRTT